MTKEEFDKLIGKVVRIRRPNNNVITVMVLENFTAWITNEWYYCHDPHAELVGKNKIAINRGNVISAEVLPEEESIIWRIKNDA